MQWVEVGRIENGRINTTFTEIPPFKDFSALNYLKSLKSSCIDHHVCNACFPKMQRIQAEQSVSCPREVTVTTAATLVKPTFARYFQCINSLEQLLKSSSVHPNLETGPQIQTLIYSKDEVYILAIFSATLFDGAACGRMDGNRLFKQLSSLLYTIGVMNKKLNGQGEVGLLIVDAFDAEAGSTQLQYVVSNGSQQIIAALNVGFPIHHRMAELAEVFEFPLITVYPIPLVEPENQWDIGLGIEAHRYAVLLCKMLKDLVLFDVNIFHETNELFFNILAAFRLCLAKNGANIHRTVALRERATDQKISDEIQVLSLSPWNVVILLLGPSNLCSVYRVMGRVELVSTPLTFIGIGFEEYLLNIWPDHEGSQLNHTWITIESHVGLDIKFVNYMASLTLNNHEPIPTLWFEAFWETQFSCTITVKNESRNGFTACTGYESLHPLMFEDRGPEGFLAFSISLLYMAIHLFSREVCHITDESPKRMFNCFKHRDHQKWLTAVQNTDPVNAIEALLNLTVNTSYSTVLIRRLVLLNGLYTFETIASSHEDVRLYSFTTHDACLFDEDDHYLGIHGDACVKNFNYSVGILRGYYEVPMVQNGWIEITTALAGIGMTVCLMAGIGYLIWHSADSISMVYNCVILVGLFMVYLSSLAFVFEPSEVTCTARVFCSGIAWVIVFAPMLLKVALSQLGIDAGKSGSLKVPPCYVVLFTFALGIIQGIIIVHWAIFNKVTLVPKTYTFVHSSMSNGVWRCAEVGKLSFDMTLVLTFFYPMLLVLLTVLFGLSGNKQKQYLGNNFILSASVVTMTNWLLLACLTMTLPYWLRDLSVAIGLIGNATAVFICLFFNVCWCRAKRTKGNYDMSTEGRLSAGTEVHTVDMTTYGSPRRSEIFNDQTFVSNSRIGSKDCPNASYCFNGVYDIGSEFSPYRFN
ncbi:7 transmembrane receptor [Trichuris suis]|nr:7 transmembrane receptor [Trichuris suis]